MALMPIDRPVCPSFNQLKASGGRIADRRLQPPADGATRASAYPPRPRGYLFRNANGYLEAAATLILVRNVFKGRRLLRCDMRTLFHAGRRPLINTPKFLLRELKRIH